MSFNEHRNGLAELGKDFRGDVVGAGLDPSGKKWRLFTFTAGKRFPVQNRDQRVQEGFMKAYVAAPSLPHLRDEEAEYWTQGNMTDLCHMVANGDQGLAILRDVFFGATLQRAHLRWNCKGPLVDNASRLTAIVQTQGNRVEFSRIAFNPLADNHQDQSLRQTFVKEVSPGYGFFMAANIGDGSPTPSLEEPFRIRMDWPLERNFWELWSSTDQTTTMFGSMKEVDKATHRSQYAQASNSDRFRSSYQAMQAVPILTA